jgi:DNA repair protein RadC
MDYDNHLPIQKCIQGEDVRSLSDQELLSIILGTGSPAMNVHELSASILRESGGFYGLMKSGIREIARHRGIGLKKAIRILAACEIGKRSISGPVHRTSIDKPQLVWKLLLPAIAGRQHEVFWVLVLNNKNRVLKKCAVSMGTVTEALVHPREVFCQAIREGGSSIIIAHNHPSGSTEPSREDIATTRRLSEAGKLLGIPLLDHIILTDTSYFSLKEAGYL